jgi:predicted alpha/beta superfamily hydrolase
LNEELLTFLHTEYNIKSFAVKAIAGFSLGGLAAIDTVWNYPEIYSIAGVFSGSLWWRIKDLSQGYNEATDRIMHQKIKQRKYVPGLKFYFATGSMDETSDRNGNGIIDSIDDTLDLIKELKQIGYADDDIRYINDEEGKHDVETWGKAMPQFLIWGWGKK